jgi:hypothetical protein
LDYNWFWFVSFHSGTLHEDFQILLGSGAMSETNQKNQKLTFEGLDVYRVILSGGSGGLVLV